MANVYSIERPKVSVIIPAYNEERYIAATIESVQHQTYCGPLEVIVVANGCSDRTAEIARRYTRQVYVKNKANLSAARNLGARHSRGDILVFLDADTRMSLTVMQHIIELYHRSSQDFFIGKCAVQPDGDEVPAHILVGVKNIMHKMGLGCGGVGILFCNRALFCTIGGFNETLHIFEFSDFIKKATEMGASVMYVSECVTTSMRRYRNMGYLSVCRFWIRNLTRFAFGRVLERQRAYR